MRDRFMLAALLLAVTLAALPLLTYPLGRDQGEFATIGRGILDGGIPYVDLWNPKPPAVFYVYAAAMALLGRTTAALRAIDFVIVPLICLCLYWLGRRIANRRVGLWAALIFPVFYFTETFWTLAQNDGIVLLPMTLAVVCAFKAADATRRAKWWAFAAGALAAYTVWFKYPFALFGVVLFITQVLGGFTLMGYGGQDAAGRDFFTRRRYSLSSPIVLAFLGGGLLLGVVGIAYMAAIGALPALVESARVTSQYTALTFNLAEFGPLLQIALGFRWQQWGLLWILAALWFVFNLRAPRQPEWRTIFFWAVAGLVIMLIQAKAYDYHWLPMLPPLALMAADSVDRVIGLITTLLIRWRFQVPRPEGEGFRVRVATSSLTALAFLCIMIISIWPRAWPYLTGQESQLAYYSRFQAGDDFIADESLQVANYLRERIAPGDSLFIWGFRPEVYYLSQLNPAVRFIFQFPLAADWYPAAWRQETVDILWAALPPYVLVLQADYMPWVTGSDDDSNTLLQSYTELNDWLIFNYERETQIGNFFLWRRKSQ